MFGIFATTFIVFPGVAIEVQPENDWYAILVVTVFNAGDVIGRFGSSSSDKAILLVAEQYLLGMTLLRFMVFVPLFIILASKMIKLHINVEMPGNKEQSTPSIIPAPEKWLQRGP